MGHWVNPKLKHHCNGGGTPEPHVCSPSLFTTAMLATSSRRYSSSNVKTSRGALVVIVFNLNLLLHDMHERYSPIIYLHRLPPAGAAGRDPMPSWTTSTSSRDAAAAEHPGSGTRRAPTSSSSARPRAWRAALFSMAGHERLAPRAPRTP